MLRRPTFERDSPPYVLHGVRYRWISREKGSRETGALNAGLSSNFQFSVAVLVEPTNSIMEFFN